MKTSDLTSDQVTRVIKYVNEMLLRFKEADDAALPGGTLQSDYPDQQGNNNNNNVSMYITLII